MSSKVFISEEKQFVYRDSFNKGHIQTPSMVENCIGLSNDAKTVYSNILNHIYEKGHSAFPSTYKLAISCSCSVNSIVTYINELVDKGLVIKVPRGRGRSNEYYLRDCSEVPLLKVSEMFWRSMAGLVNLYGWRKLHPAKEKIISFMDSVGYRLQDMATDDETSKQLTALLKHVLKGGKLEVGLLPRNVKFGKQPEVEISTPGADNQNTSLSEKLPTKHTTTRSIAVGMDKNHWKLVDVDEWQVKQFKEYYYDKYLDVTGQPHPRNQKKHTGMVKRIMSNMEGKNELLREYMDTVFEIGYDNVTLDYLSSNRIGEIQTYLVSGKRPFYLERQRPEAGNETLTVEKTNMTSKELMDKLLGGNK
ncbi:helix-turn-helix domain-containing protein [Pseudobacillus badius]|uniref:helix-turn-helix domain-containing protein n=1 Tax=Bacillus badius TaxID=1455 RepID=UPI0007B3668D|nr:helix-turn-helix domain-containing protein [Bacillus badius]